MLEKRENETTTEFTVRRMKAEFMDEAARVVEQWSLPTIQTPSMWLIDKAGIAAAIRALAE